VSEQFRNVSTSALTASTTVIYDVTYCLIHRIFGTNLQYSSASFIHELYEKFSTAGVF